MKARLEPGSSWMKAKEGTFEELLDRELRRLHALADHVEMRADDAADHRLEQFDLGLEVEIREPLAHFGAGGDVFEPGAGKALLGEFLEGRGNDLLRARILLAPALLAPASFAPLIWCQAMGSVLASSQREKTGRARPVLASLAYND